MARRDRLPLALAALALAVALGQSPAFAVGAGKLRAIVIQVLDELTITSGGVYTTPTLATVSAAGATTATQLVLDGGIVSTSGTSLAIDTVGSGDDVDVTAGRRVDLTGTLGVDILAAGNSLLTVTADGVEVSIDDQDFAITSTGSGQFTTESAAITYLDQSIALVNSSGVSAGSLLCPMGEVSFVDSSSIAVATSISVQGTWYPLAIPATYAGDDNREVDTPSAGVWRYTGTSTKMFHVAVTFSCQRPGGGAGALDYHFAVFKNGAIIPGSEVHITYASQSSVHSTAIHTYPTLSQGDTLQLYATNTDGTQDIVAETVCIFGLGMQ